MNKIIGFVEGADVYLVTSLLIFLLVFVVVSVQMFLMKKDTSDKMSMLPFHNSNSDNNEN
ncbi:hypothetical protein GYB22_11295 [bacterium]|nr:hypothetical protein [bacterium]